MAWWDILTGGAQGVPFGISPPSAGAAVGQAATDPTALEGQLAQRKRTADMTDYMLTQSPFAQALMAPVRGFEGVTDVITGQKPYEAVYPDGSVRTSPQFIGDVADVAGSIGVGGVGAAANRPGSSLGIFGGRMAKNAPLDDLTRAEAMEQAGQNADDIWRSTGWGRGADGDWRFEIDDGQVYWEPETTGEYKDVVYHPLLSRHYPSPGVTWVENAPDLRSAAQYTPGTIEIGPDAGRNTLIHELQHGLQHVEKWAGGGHTDEPDYRRLAGEVEARNAARRIDMTADERRQLPPWATEDVPRAQQIVRKR
jgi:hypothetical protein